MIWRRFGAGRACGDKSPGRCVIWRNPHAENRSNGPPKPEQRPTEAGATDHGSRRPPGQRPTEPEQRPTEPEAARAAAHPPFDAPFTPCVEVGWRLARAHWGAGYATEAARAAITDGFERLKLDEIVSFTTVGNEASRQVMARLDLVFVQWMPDAPIDLFRALPQNPARAEEQRRHNVANDRQT